MLQNHDRLEPVEHIAPAPLPTLSGVQLTVAIDAAIRAIPPAWPLASSVAVNPFLGQTHEPLQNTAARLERTAGLAITMPRSWYREKIASGEITDADLASATARLGFADRITVANIRAGAGTAPSRPQPTATVLNLASAASDMDWRHLFDDRLGNWAAGYFDAGQALWAAPRGLSAYASWRASAMYDLTPEIVGLKGFAQFIADAPDNAPAAIKMCARTLELEPDACENYFHQLLFETAGWGQYARYLLWQAELAGDTDTTLHDLLAIRLLWETALHRQFGPAVDAAWARARAEHAAPLVASADHELDACLQLALEHANQRVLIETLTAAPVRRILGRPVLQAAFCIDVRSEIYRRALEAVSPDIQTIGFAGFFGIATAHKAFASDVDELRLPVLLKPGLRSCSGSATDKDIDTQARWSARAKRAWGRFKLAAVSSFAFVEAAGPVYAGELVRDALGLDAKPAPNEPAPRLVTELTAEQKLGAAETVLRAMSMTGNFARVVLLAGHGANVVNNPHESALHCGACGGYSGEVNARLLAAVLNEAEVRHGLIGKGITVPDDTVFVAAHHDTTTDTVTLYDGDHPSPDHGDDFRTVRAWLETAGRTTRQERALRLPLAEDGRAIAIRSRDWSQLRPEWALAGCCAFIAAPRDRTAGKSLNGRAFLHDYNWQKDDGFPVLELIMTAPVVVASWISLQYYGSVVAPGAFGAGNKLLHNVTGGIGVVEGNGGALRTGLPWQSVHDGESLVHEPVRLTVFIEAPTDAMTDILARHDGVRTLFDNGWLHLIALDNGQPSARYCGDLIWQPM